MDFLVSGRIPITLGEAAFYPTQRVYHGFSRSPINDFNITTLPQLALRVGPHKVTQVSLLGRVPKVELLFMFQTALQPVCPSFPAHPRCRAASAQAWAGLPGFCGNGPAPHFRLQTAVEFLLLLKPPLPLHTGPSSSADFLEVVS